MKRVLTSTVERRWPTRLRRLSTPAGPETGPLPPRVPPSSGGQQPLRSFRGRRSRVLGGLASPGACRTLLGRTAGRRAFETVPERGHAATALSKAQLDLQRILRQRTRVFWSSLGVASTLCAALTYTYWDNGLKENVSKPLAQVSQDIILNEELRTTAEEVGQKFVCDLLMTQVTLDTLTRLAVKLIQQPHVVEAARDLVVKVIQDPYIVDEFNKLVGGSLVDEYNQNLLYDLIWKVLDNPEVQAKAKETIQEIVRDGDLQSHSSDALWNVITGALLPGMPGFSKGGPATVLPDGPHVVVGSPLAPESSNAEQTAPPHSTTQTAVPDPGIAPPATA